MIGAISDGKIHLIGARQSKVRILILEVLTEHEELTISQIQKKLKEKGHSYNYRSIWQHVTAMNGNWVETEKKEHEPGQPVVVKLIKILRDTEMKKALATSLALLVTSPPGGRGPSGEGHLNPQFHNFSYDSSAHHHSSRSRTDAYRRPINVRSPLTPRSRLALPVSFSKRGIPAG